jgi:hypothetical protein
VARTKNEGFPLSDPLDSLGRTTLSHFDFLDLNPRCRVDRQAIREELARTEHQLVDVAARIEKQKAVINRLEAMGESTAYAAFLLEQALGWQRVNEAHRTRLKRELAQA